MGYSIIYKQTILPILDYGDFMIESGTIRRLNGLEKLQLRSLKVREGRSALGLG